ncbi:MAG TPA: NUDIX domain-containing protein [Nitrososphaeraceae archaeon]
MRNEISCGALVYCIENQDVKFLLLRYSQGHWDFPKGNKEKGETNLETTRREIKEETGISDIVFRDRFEKEITYNYSRQNEKISKKVIYFLAKTKATNVVLSSEHTDFVWELYENALKRLTYKNAKEILTQGYNFLKHL